MYFSDHTCACSYRRPPPSTSFSPRGRSEVHPRCRGWSWAEWWPQCRSQSRKDDKPWREDQSLRATTDPCSNWTTTYSSKKYHSERMSVYKGKSGKKAAQYTGCGSMVALGRGNEKFHMSLSWLVNRHTVAQKKKEMRWREVETGSTGSNKRVSERWK